MRTLIIGASGLTGQCLCQLLDEQGEDYLGTVLPEEMAGENMGKRRVPLNLLQQTEIFSLLADYMPDRIFNLAAQNSVREAWSAPNATVDININGVIRLLDAAREVCPHATICLLGAGEEYGRVPFHHIPISEEEPMRPINLYAATKTCQNMIAEIYHNAYGMRIVIARAFNIIGSGQSDKYSVSDFCRQTVRIRCGVQRAYTVGNLNVQRDFVDVRDLARGMLLLSRFGRSGEIYNIGSGKAVSLQEILDLLRELSGVSADICVENKRIRRADVPKMEADISKIRKDTGWFPQISLRQSVTDMLDYWQKKRN